MSLPLPAWVDQAIREIPRSDTRAKCWTIVEELRARCRERIDSKGSLGYAVISFEQLAGLIWSSPTKQIPRRHAIRMIQKIEGMGLIVRVAQGGSIVEPGTKRQRAANAWAIPGQRGALDHRRVNPDNKEPQRLTADLKKMAVLGSTCHPT